MRLVPALLLSIAKSLPTSAIRLLFLMCVVALPALCHSGVEVNPRLTDGSVLRATLSGAVTKESVKQIESALSEGRGRLIWLDLNSAGGDWDAAIAIGRQLRKVNSLAQVSDGDECSSACVLILAGAQIRLVSSKGRVGIHRPYSPTSTPISLEQSRRRYQALSTATRTYLREMNIPESLFDAMVRIPPERLRILSEREIDEFGLEGKDPAYVDFVDSENANALGIDKQEYLKRKAQAESLCAELGARLVALQENSSKSGRPIPRQKLDEGLSLGKKWMQCREAVMRGERK